ncbi:UNVERIFIED_CONTAM: hypothetical protein GTU68_042485 [Idotea baltica]|nr:hypothetical protein [Idotea baltica]
MKRSRLLNSELSYEIARVGHTASVTLCDAGLPIPSGVKRIDLAIESGYPSFLRTLDVLLSEMMVEEIVVAEEIHLHNPSVYDEMMKLFSHDEFKNLTRESEAIVRTGECTPYANVILKSGVVF